MGSCWSATLPDDDEYTSRREHGKLKVLSEFPASSATPGDQYGKEETRQKELFAALRTGLVFTPTEFSVLPGICTAAKVIFTIGSSELQRLQDSEQQNLTLSQEEDKEEESEDVEDGNAEDDDSLSEPNINKEPIKLKVTLKGQAWTNGLSMKLEVWPVVGPFVGQKLSFHWREHILTVEGFKMGELNARSLPENFETETDFCKCCLLLTYQPTTDRLQFDEDTAMEEENTNTLGDTFPSLMSLAYKKAVSNLDSVPQSVIIPSKFYHLFFGMYSPIATQVRIWPNTFAQQLTASPTMKVKAGLLFAEFVYLLREHFQIPPNHSLKLYHNYKPVQMSDLISSRYKILDCFVVQHQNDIGGSYTSLEEEESNNVSTLVVSLVGYDIKNIDADLDMSLKDFDKLLRSKFNLRKDSFLIILSEGDFDPQYNADDGWKCTYPFSLPDNSFSAGLRRSFRRFSSRGTNRLTQSQRDRASSSNLENSTFTPLIAKVLVLLSSDARNFPSNSGKYSLSTQELYGSMPMYQMSLERCGIHPYAIVNVFEVTGPSIPISFRVLSEDSAGSSQLLSNTPRTRHANVMDINPNWSVDTFLQYTDAIVSPSSSVRHKRLSIRENSIDDSKDLSSLTLGELLDIWKPVWWPGTGKNRKQLITRDMDPSEFLVIEKF